MAGHIRLSDLQTEARNSQSTRIDTATTTELCRILNDEDASVSTAVKTQIPIIAQVIEVLTERVRRGGRVFYLGAGTSGRLGVLDASEIPPTYSSPRDQFIGLIAGGDEALRNAIEGAEDDRSGAEADLGPFHLNPEVDSLIGIASSGRTPYVLGGLAHAKSLGSSLVTVGLVCVEPSAIRREGNADHVIAPVTGPEVVTGSTRMKAGTATKLVLNMISTGIMIKLGKTYGNLMIDMKASNYKLDQRAKSILRTLTRHDNRVYSDEELGQLLQSCSGSVKLAAAALMLQLPVDEASVRLRNSHGVLSKALQGNTTDSASVTEDVVLCVDAGGSGCKATIMSRGGNAGSGVSRPCNVSSIGVEAAIAVISDAVQCAVDNHPATKGRHFRDISFRSIKIGMAGYDRPALAPLINKALMKLFDTSINDNNMSVTCDVDLLTVGLEGTARTENVIALIAGTGSVAMSYGKEDNSACLRRTGRVGGWGHLLGDDGSGYGIAREAIRRALRFHERSQLLGSSEAYKESSSHLYQAVVGHFQSRSCASSPPSRTTIDFLSSILADGLSTSLANHIASVAPVILDLVQEDTECQQVIEQAVASLLEMVELLVQAQNIDITKSALVLGGGLMRDDSYRFKILDAIEIKLGKAAVIEVVTDPAATVAKHLLQTLPSITTIVGPEA